MRNAPQGVQAVSGFGYPAGAGSLFYNYLIRYVEADVKGRRGVGSPAMKELAYFSR
jgi:hypothetical protein